MYALLVILGAVIAALGVVIAVPGWPLLGREFDGSIVTPAAVAVVGGLILVGLGLVVRVLYRIERALATRPLPRPAIPAEAAVATAVEEPEARPKVAAPARITFPPKPEARPLTAPAANGVKPPLPEDAAVEGLREQFPTLVRIESAPVVEAEVLLLPKPPRADDEATEVNGKAAPGPVGVAATARAEPRLDIPSRPANRPERTRNFDAYWPKKPLPARGAQATAPAVVVPLPVEPVLPAEPTQVQLSEPEAEPPTPAPAVETLASVSVLKSGVVDGMAYTLYSDGSIEAQLPQGTLRFGSIAELRTHIEHSA